MKLSYILENLTYGELKQIGVGGSKEGGIQPDNYIEIINHINIALENLYTKFPIKEKELLMEAQLDVEQYHLHSSHAVSVDEDEGFILDSVEYPFTNDIIRINGIYDGDGYKLPLNDPSDPLSVYLPSYDVIQIPTAIAGQRFAIIYRAGATTIIVPSDPTTLDLDQEVYLPKILLEPLLIYVYYRIQKGQGGEVGLALSIATKDAYNTAILDIERRNLLNNAANVTNIKPKLRGWC